MWIRLLSLFFPFFLSGQQAVFLQADTQHFCLKKDTVLYFGQVRGKDTLCFLALQRVFGGFSGPSLAVAGQTVFIAWSDEKSGEGNKDVFLLLSSDNGKYWTDPMLVTYWPNHRDQFAPVLFRRGGSVQLAFLDCRNYSEKGFADIMLLELSADSLLFAGTKINAQPVSSEGRPVLRFSAKGDSLILEHGLNKRAFPAKRLQGPVVKEFQIERMHKWKEKLLITFTATEDTRLTATLTKPMDPAFQALLVREKAVRRGRQTLLVNFKAMSLKKEAYVLNLYQNGQHQYCWIIP